VDARTGRTACHAERTPKSENRPTRAPRGPASIADGAVAEKQRDEEGASVRRRPGVGPILAALAVTATIVSPSARSAGTAFPGGVGRIAMTVVVPGHSAEIWTVSSAGAGLRRIIHTRTDAVAPSWSSDGRRLTLVIGGAVWRVNGDGQRLVRVTGRSIVDPESPSWSPGGKRIVFAARTSGANFDIYVCRTDGSGLRRLTRSRLPDEHPSWSPDGKRIVFSRATSTLRSELWLMNANGSAQRRIGLGGSPDWSPDGKRIAFSLGAAIAVMRLDGTGLTRLVDGPGAAGDPAWSPDGRSIVFWSDRASGEATKGDLYVVSGDGGAARRVTQQPALWHFDPSWQPLAPFRIAPQTPKEDQLP
jgi:Tol biopolymer transport system component